MNDETPRLCVIGARTAFDNDPAWLRALSNVARALGAIESHRHVVLQVRIEDDRLDHSDDVPHDSRPGHAHVDATSLAAHALDAVRSFAPDALRVVLNARGVDAMRCGYDGVHWPERRIPDAPVSGEGTHSASVHSVDAMRRAEHAGVDYVQFGPIWEPTWKVATPCGLGALAEATRAARVPVVAVGGVRAERVASCIEAGAHGVAVVSGVLGAQDTLEALRRYFTALDTATQTQPG